jgi:hypothetical protein
MIAAGTYLVKAVESLSLRESKTGTKFAHVQFMVNGEPIAWQGWLTEKAEARTADTLTLLGFDGSDPATVMNSEVSITVEHETYTTPEGVERVSAKIQWINDPNRARGMGQPMQPGEAAQAMARLKGLVLAAKAKAGTAAAPAPTAKRRF